MAAGVLSAATPAIVLFITPGSLIPVIKRNSPITSDIVTGLTNTFFIFIISLRRVIITIPYVHCNRLRILALSEDAARAVSESLGDAGEIRLCLRSSAVLVSNVLKDFIHEQPHVSFSISSEPKGCDLLIDSVSSAYDIPDNAHLLMTEEICLAVSSSHPLAHTGHISVEQMMDEKFIDLADTPSYAGVFNSIFSKFKKTPQIAYSCNDYILQGKLISLGLGVSFVASVTWTSSSLPESISLLHIDDCPHFRSIYYQPLGSFCSENQRIFEHQLEEYFKKLNK